MQFLENLIQTIRTNLKYNRINRWNISAQVDLVVYNSYTQFKISEDVIKI